MLYIFTTSKRKSINYYDKHIERYCTTIQMPDAVATVTWWGTWRAKSYSSLGASVAAYAPRIGAASPGPMDRLDGAPAVSAGRHRANIAMPFDMKF